ncbi:MAG TPA: hypothetical protein VJY37_00650 [Anaerovoracaceae bacterium]|nr:hypothetical protein [Anaerovoracaceae bacterium]
MIIKGSLEMLRDYLSSKLVEQRKLLLRLPKQEYIRVISRGKKYYYRIDDEGKRKSVTKDKILVDRIESREKALKIIPRLENNLKVLDECCKRYIPFCYWDISLQDMPRRQNSMPDNGRNLVVNGIYYKSKSEMIIALILEKLELEYAYETRIAADGEVFYPDFAVKRPSDGRIIYLEHCGMISEEGYNERLAYKISKYYSEGIVLWSNLILTFDELDGGFDAVSAEKVIRTYLLE